MFRWYVVSEHKWMFRAMVAILLLKVVGTALAGEPLGVPLWQLGEFFDGGQEFVGQSLTDAEFEISVTGALKDRVPLPAFLAGPDAEGCRRMHIRFPLDQGWYALVRSVKRPAEGVAPLCQVFINGRELGCFFTTACPDEAPNKQGPTQPASRDTGLYLSRAGSCLVEAPSEYQCVAYPFACLSKGRQELVLSLAAETNRGLRLELDALALVAWTVSPRPHSLREEVPGRVFLDAWGWNGTVWYQRTGRADMAYFQNRLIDESAIRGANYLQLHPSLDQNPWARAGIEARPLLEAIHARDMVVDEHCFPPKIGRQEDQDKASSSPRRRDRAARRESKREQSDRTNREKVVTPEIILQWFQETWAPLVADIPQRGWREAVDGFEGEAFNAVFENPAALKRMVDLLWRWNPGMWVSHASFPAGPVWLSQAKYRTPNYLKSPVCLHFLGFELGPPEGRVGMVGYDDKVPVIHPFPACEGLHQPSGKIFLGYQADCRKQGAPARRQPLRIIGGGSSADWILKQADDFFRPRSRWPDDPHETAIWWLGEPPETLPLEYRDYVYAITQDPIKRALAATHAHDGVGGFLDQRKQQLQEQAQNEGINTSGVEWWKLRLRSEFPASAHFIQNGYLRLNLFTDRDGGVLQYDMERLAHFDSDGLNLPLTDHLVSMTGNAPATGSSAESPASFKQTFEITQRGGHLAVLEARAEWSPGPQKQVVEQRRYLVVNDAPYVLLELARTSSGFDGEVCLAMGSDGYDTLVADGKELVKQAMFARDSLPKVLHLRDSTGVRPDLAVLLLDRGQTSAIEWHADQSIILRGPAEEHLRLAWVVPTDLYSPADLPKLAEAMDKLIYPVTWKKDGATVTNPWDVAYVAVAEINDPGDGPYLVQEKGWWTVRGAQRRLEQEVKRDYLKLYLSPRESVRLQPYGHIDGAAKPGYGCQYTVALREVRGGDREASCQARVLSVTPFLFAPRVDFAKPIRSARVDGQPWHYFEDSLVFLPNRVGDYRVQVEYGPVSEPGVTRTFASVNKTIWAGSTFELEVSDPPWVASLPPDVSYYALMRLPAGQPREVKGGTLLEQKGQTWLLQFKPGNVRLSWEKREKGGHY